MNEFIIFVILGVISVPLSVIVLIQKKLKYENNNYIFLKDELRMVTLREYKRIVTKKRNEKWKSRQQMLKKEIASFFLYIKKIRNIHTQTKKTRMDAIQSK